MIRALLIIFFFVALLSQACSNKPTNIHVGNTLVAWNEDTVNSYQITLVANKNFYYSIIKTENGARSPKSFSGTYRLSYDSILLNYKGSKPPELVSYLINEASGNYVIQYFTNTTKMMFLRRQKLDHRF